MTITAIPWSAQYLAEECKSPTHGDDAGTLHIPNYEWNHIMRIMGMPISMINRTTFNSRQQEWLVHHASD